MSMKQRMEKKVSTLREKVRRAGIIRKTVGLGLAIVMVLETPSWSGLIGSALAREDKVRGGRCIYVDTSLIGADSDVMESGIGAYVYDREGNSYSDAPIIMEKVEGKRNIYQLVLDDYYTYVEFTKGSDLNASAKTGALAIDWSLGSPCYMFNSEALSDGGHFYGLYTVYFDLNDAPGASEFADSGVGIYAYNSETESYSIVPVAMKESSKGNGIYEYSFDKPYDYVAFMGGYGTWNYKVATAPVYAEWEYHAPCFLLSSVDGLESAGTWRDLTYVVYFDASEIKEDEAFEENGVYLYAYSDSGDVLSENPVKMVASSKGGYIYEYTMEKPYENVQFILGDSFDAEIQSEVFRLDWLSYADPCYTMTLDRIEKVSPSPSVSPSTSPSASPSGSPSATPSGSPDVTPSVSPSTTPSGSPLATPSASPSATATPSITPEPTSTATPTKMPEPTPTATPGLADEPTPTPEATDEPTPTPEPTDEPAPTPEPTKEPETISIEQSKANSLSITHGSYTMSWVGTESDTLAIDNLSNPDSSVPTDLEGGDSTITSPTIEEENPSEQEGEGTDTEEDTDLTQSPDKDEELTGDTADVTDGDEVIVDGEWSYDEAHGKAARPATVRMLSRAATRTKVIYFDAGKNPSGYGWQNGNIYVVFIGNDGFYRMDLSTRTNTIAGYSGPLYELAVPEGITAWSGVIFMTRDGWLSGVGSSEYQVQTIDGNFTADDNAVCPCYSLTGTTKNENGGIKQELVYIGDLGPLSKAGDKMYFVDMTSASGANDITVASLNIDDADLDDAEAGAETDGEESGSEESDLEEPDAADDELDAAETYNANADAIAAYIADTSDVIARFYTESGSPIDVHKDEATGAYEVPADDSLNGAYTSVAFFDNNNRQLGEEYDFLEFLDEKTMNTFYYGVTEKANGDIISKWGAKPGGKVTQLAGKKLYFDSVYFKTAEAGEAKFQIGDEEPVVLEMDEDDTSEFSYLFEDDSSATSQTILTYISKDEEIKYHFFWDTFDAGATELDEVTVEYDVASVEYIHEMGDEVYFDASMSKMSYAGTNDVKNGGKGIPYPDTTNVYFYAMKENGETKSGLMTLADPKEGWKDVYKVSLDPEYTKIRFAAYEITSSNYDKESLNGDGTAMLDIPRRTVKNPCYYADNSDNVIYYGGNRDGYWGEVYTIRDAEAGKGTTVVDIASSTLERQNDYYYVSSTLYDYYTDYELNGFNRDNYNGVDGSSHRAWVTFRQFDEALSDYYRENDVKVPLYTGHFQSVPDSQFDDLMGALPLWGLTNEGIREWKWYDYHTFYSINNSAVQMGGTTGGNYSMIAQGLVNNQLVNGELMAKTSGNVPQPHFSEDFLTGNNSKNAVLGKVYENVAFPFKSVDRDKNGVKYWCFDAADTTLAMRQDSDQYYLEIIQDSTGKTEKEAVPWSRNLNSTGYTQTGANGFFPFNEGSTENSAMTYNYGYGAKLEINFRLTPEGTVKDNKNNDVPITFEFAGDDDVWVFIDGTLVLDVGGSHGRATGKINFETCTVETGAVKSSPGGTTPTSFTLKGKKEDEHTLVMYYMERGMWESNMKINFNFPDENQLVVEKEIDDSTVNQELFGSLFDDISFPFYIRNQATHFGKYAAEGSVSQIVDLTYSDEFNKIDKSVDRNTFRYVDSFAGRDKVVLWNALDDDADHRWQPQRLGYIYPDAGASVDASGEYKYLEFRYYYDYSDTPSLRHMYLEFVSNNGTVRAFLNDKLAAGESQVLRSKEWSKIVVDLSKFQGVDWSTLTRIGFGYSYSRDIYLDKFVFKGSTTVNQKTGFITKQWEIPDYGSSTSGNLEYPEGALYTLANKSNPGSATWNVIGDSGSFTLGDGDYATFRDQFRRGSYIELKEYADPEAFTTTWTMYEDTDSRVNTMKDGDKVDLESPIPSMVNVSRPDNAVYDGRTEYHSGDYVESEGMANGGYTTAHRPDAPTFVFRSYALPDYDNGMVKLRVLYRNTVNTGSITIRKSADIGSEKLEGEYKFLITFTNVAGMGLEGGTPITKEITLRNGQSQTITGIPIKTEYTIVETMNDGSFLSKVTEAGNKAFTFDTDTKVVRGQVVGAPGTNYNFTFANMKKETIDIEVEKKWVDAAGNPIIENDPINKPILPESVTILLQRKTDKDEVWFDVPHEDETKWESVLGEGYERSWEYTFTNLDKYVDNDRSKGVWKYRIVELGEDGKILPEDGLWDVYQVSYKAPEFVSTNETQTVDSYEASITNIHTVSLQIEKVDAIGGHLKGVSFQLLEKVGPEEWKTVELEGVENNTVTTEADGICTFNNLPRGEYKLIETATAPGHTLLASPILITISEAGCTYTINETTKNVTIKNNTIELRLINGQQLTMPATGGAGPIPFTVGGLSICMIASLMYIDSMRKRRKEGKAS